MLEAPAKALGPPLFRVSDRLVVMSPPATFALLCHGASCNSQNIQILATGKAHQPYRAGMRILFNGAAASTRIGEQSSPPPVCKDRQDGSRWYSPKL